jgi:hypothetical protein
MKETRKKEKKDKTRNNGNARNNLSVSLESPIFSS